MSLLEKFLKCCHRLYVDLYVPEAAALLLDDVDPADGPDDGSGDNAGEALGGGFDVEFDNGLDEGLDSLAGIEGIEKGAPGGRQAGAATPIEELDLSVRAYNCLKRAGIHTAGAIAERSQYWLLHNVRNLGRKSLAEVVDKLAQLEFFIPEYADGETPESPDEPAALDVLNDMVGLSEVKERMKDLTAHCAIQKRKSQVCGAEYPVIPNMVFLGNPGTGKTAVAKLAARLFQEIGLLKRGHLVSVTRTDLVAEYTGQSAVKTTRVFKAALDGVLFVDEAYSLYHQTGSEQAGDTFSCEVLDTLTALMSEYAGRCCVIFAGYEAEMNHLLENANPGLRERFPFKLRFEDYNAQELREIFLRKARQRQLMIADEGLAILTETLERLCANKNGQFANGRAAENFLQEVVLRQERRLFDRGPEDGELTEAELLTLTGDDFSQAARFVLAALPGPVPARRPLGFISTAHAA
jgi:hypothetical protein